MEPVRVSEAGLVDYSHFVANDSTVSDAHLVTKWNNGRYIRKDGCHW